MMNIDIANLGELETREFSFVTTAAELDAVAADVDFVGEIAARGELRYTGSSYLVSGEIACRRAFLCDRCLAPCEEGQVLPFSEDFASDGDEITEGMLDISAAVRDILVASQPIGHLCRPDCLGLCPECGANLNEGDCGHRQKELDSRLLALADFINKD